MVEWLGLKPGDRVLEPSAGHGAISRYFGAETRNTIVEPSPELATLAKLRLNGGSTAKVIEGRFEDLDIHNKYEGIVMTNFSGYKYCNRSHQTSGCCCSQYQIRKAC